MRAVWSMMVGFFLIVVDSTVVTVANPVIKQQFSASYDAVIWVTSAYLSAFAVLMLLGGRLGDRFGPKNVYLAGLAVFTAASVWCGTAGSIGLLIGGRVAQGVGAALMTPQTLSAITRTFPPERRGIAMSIWGATAGIGMFVGPLAGGALVDSLGWRWIFLVNAPLGLIGLGLAARAVPAIPGRPHRLDPFGVALSGVGICLIVFGLQEGQHHGWASWIWGVIACGLAVIVVFIFWQRVGHHEPLIPLTLFSHRDFGLASAGVAMISFTAIACAIPLMFYLQEVGGLPPIRSALVTAPMAIATGVLAPVVGRLVDRVPVRPIIGLGFAILTIALLWLAAEMTPGTPPWQLMLPLAMMGAAGAMVWEPLAVAASRTLPAELAGAGSGVYNTVRQIGAVLGSACIAALMASMSLRESMILPAVVAALGAITAVFLVGHRSPEASVVTHPPGRNVSAAL
ncbi:DHA2 family efflux MFS transporter permease subunit [Mycobacterium sp. NPDC048908]|uniref:DHA2 family efflux MFS transporter permease subunit n=1 Tax=Mycobacterium sp. NPDC048908 TaxID=3364292 RepID=UPI003711FF97